MSDKLASSMEPAEPAFSYLGEPEKSSEMPDWLKQQLSEIYGPESLEEIEQESSRLSSTDDTSAENGDLSAPLPGFTTNIPCETALPDVFFPDSESPDYARKVEQAKAICKTCGIIDDCLKSAVENAVEHGVWGGTSEEERQALIRRSLRPRS